MHDDHDEEDLDELMAELEAEEAAYEAGVPQPRLRAIYRNRKLTLIPYGPHLAGPGPARMMLEQAPREVVVADLAENPESEGSHLWELTVTPRSPGGLSGAAERAILRWARNVGYGRVWLPDRVERLGLMPSPESVARVDCGCCGHEWTASGHDFWRSVAGGRSFPSYCLLCGGDLPAWRVERPARRKPRTHRREGAHARRR